MMVNKKYIHLIYDYNNDDDYDHDDDQTKPNKNHHHDCRFISIFDFMIIVLFYSVDFYFNFN